MRRSDSQNNGQPRQRSIIREENMAYDMIDSDRTRLRPPSTREQPIEIDVDYDRNEVFENESSVDGSNMKYDHAMEDLLQQLPSRQLENVAETASRTLWRKHLGSSSRPGTMRIQKSNDFQNHISEALRSDLNDDGQLYNDLDEAVRTIPTTLTQKRTIKKKLSVKQKRHLSRYKLCKYWFAMQWRRIKYKVISATRLFGLWKSHLKVIEGRFGTSVVSYFIFLKWVLLINIPIFLLTFSFLVIPQIVYQHYHKNSPSYKDNDQDFTGIEILTGTGFFKDTEMYYGFYTNETVDVIENNKYEMKYAYILTCWGYYLFCLLILGFSYLRSYRKYYIEVSGTLRQYYFGLAICGWDYGITSLEAAQLKHRSIYNEFKEYLAGMKVKTKKTRNEIIKKWSIRLLAWIVVLGLLCVSGYVTYIVSTELSLKPYVANSTTHIASSLAMPFVISSIQWIIPVAFTFLEGYEQFAMPKYELFIHMFREQLLRATMLAVLVYFWLNVASSKVECWETFVGQEIYRLTIMDMIFGLLYSFFMEFIRKLCSLKWKSIERAEFAIARHTLELIYTQSLCWLGVFYCPLLPVVVIAKLLITFYVKRYSVVQNCRPSLKPWRASRTHTHFVGYIFIFFICMGVAVFFSILKIQPSRTCGPYQNYETSYDVISKLVSTWENNYKVFGQIVRFIFSPGFVSGFLVVLCVMVYYSRAIMQSRRSRVEQFQKQLLLEGEDKKFLLNLLNHVKVSQDYSKPGPSKPTVVQQHSHQQPQGSMNFSN